MARRKKRSGDGVKEEWLITFSDLMTLLLTFFVLILSMSSMSRTIFTQVNAFISPYNFIDSRGSGRISDRLRLILQLLREPQLDHAQNLKDLVFPHDVLPEYMDKSTLDQNLEVLRTKEGLAIIMTDSLVFESGSFTLTPLAKKMLQSLVEVLHHTTADVNISGYTDNQPAPPPLTNMELSGRRALAVLEFFLNEAHLRPARFSISGYGADRPMAPNDTAFGRARNRRVEILIKNEEWLGKYRG